MESLLIAIGLLIVAFVFCMRLFLPRETWTKLLAELIHDGLQGVWHLIFGPRKVRIVPKRMKGAKKKTKRKP